MERTKGFATGFILGVAAGVGGAFLAYKKRRHLKGLLWKWEAKADIHRRLGALKRLTRASYDEIVDDVLARYEAAGGVAESELAAFGTDLKRRYSDIKARLAEAAEDEE